MRRCNVPEKPPQFLRFRWNTVERKIRYLERLAAKLIGKVSSSPANSGALSRLRFGSKRVGVFRQRNAIEENPPAHCREGGPKGARRTPGVPHAHRESWAIAVWPPKNRELPLMLGRSLGPTEREDFGLVFALESKSVDVQLTEDEIRRRLARWKA